MKKTLQISLEDAKEMIKVLPAMKDTLEELYPELKPSVVPDSWYKIDGRLRGFYIHNTDSIVLEVCNTSYSKRNTNTFATEKQAKSALAYAQLTQLMKATGDCDINWSNTATLKFIILRKNNDLIKHNLSVMYHPIAFKTESIRNQFFVKHQELLKQYFEL